MARCFQLGQRLAATRALQPPAAIAKIERFTDPIGNPPDALDAARGSAVQHLAQAGKIGPQGAPYLILNLHADYGSEAASQSPAASYGAGVGLARSQRKALAALVTRRLPIAVAVYAREFLLTPGGLVTCAGGYGFALAVAADLSAYGMPASGVPANLIFAYLATAAASGVYLNGLRGLPIAFFKLTPVSFARLTGFLVAPHLAVVAPITLAALALELAAGGAPATLGLLLLQMFVLPLLAWLVAVRHLHRALLPSLFYALLALSGLVAAVVRPLLFVGLCAAVLWFLYRAASARYLAATADEWPEPDDPV